MPPKGCWWQERLAKLDKGEEVAGGFGKPVWRYTGADSF